MQASPVLLNNLESSTSKKLRNGHKLIGKLTRNALQRLTSLSKPHEKIASGSTLTTMILLDVSSNTTAEDMMLSLRDIQLEELRKLQQMILFTNSK
jgi:hypothetical protein